ncbi:MAG: GTP 3',8-cyclase MoaA [Chlorobiaceae bacterium]|nr:GTP 3',8-cyclase MoaA [Chlorobiaceae bacterium]
MLNQDRLKERQTMTDRYGRTIDYVRIAVTSACNLRCSYCLREEHDESKSGSTQLDVERIGTFIRLLAEMGIRKIRFTGGEPLLRRDIARLVRIAKTTPGIDNVKLTTNGVLLDRYLDELIEAGLDGINLSLDTLDAEKFKAIARRDQFPKVRKALDMLLQTPSLRLKINTLMLRGINNDEIPAFVELGRDHDLTVRFMELQPFDDRQIWRTGRFMGAEMIREHLYRAYPQLEAVTGLDTEHYSFRLPGYRGSVAIIPAYSRNFCSRCSRLRITADGKLISCLYQQESIDLMPLTENSNGDEELRKKILDAVSRKPKDGLKNGTNNAVTSMSQIGG